MPVKKYTPLEELLKKSEGVAKDRPLTPSEYEQIVAGAIQNAPEVETPYRKRKVRLEDIEPFRGVLETIDSARDFLSDILQTTSKLFALRVDTGAGKTETGITYAFDANIGILTQSKGLRDDVVKRAVDDHGIHAYGYKGIHESDESDGYLPCPDAQRFDLLRRKGYNPYIFICGECLLQDECMERGYRSNEKRIRESQLIAYPFPQGFIDPRLGAWAKRHFPRGRDTIILHDDIPLPALYIEFALPAERLRKIIKDWDVTKAAWIAEGMLECFIKRDWERFKNLITSMDGDHTYSLREAFSSCIDPDTGVIIDSGEYLLHPKVSYSTPDACAALPVVDKRGAEISDRLVEFFTRYPRIKDAPFYYNTKDEAFHFFLPPEPMRLKETMKIGFASATLSKTLTEKIFPGIEFHDAGLTEWVEGAKFCQLRTNANPRSTVLDGEALTATGDEYYHYVIDFIKAHPNDRHAVITYKVTLAEKADELKALNVVTANYGNVAGLNEDFKEVKYFHILFSPEVNPRDIELMAKQIFGCDIEPLKRDDDGNLERVAEGYTDTRVQEIYNSLVIAELRQAIGRARLNLYPNQVILWSSKFIDAYTNRQGTVIFGEEDWRKSNNDLDSLVEVVKAREAARDEALGDVGKTMTAHDVKKSQAYKLTETDRKRAKAERNAEIHRRSLSGQSNRRIATEMGIGQGTVKRVLEG